MTRFLCFLALIISLPDFCRAEEADAAPVRIDRPLFVPSVRFQHPLNMLHLSAEAESPEIIPCGEDVWSVTGIWSNTFNPPRGGDFVDVESRRAELRYARGLGGGISVEALLPWTWTGVGILDQPIQEYHDFYFLPNGRREDYAQDEFHLSGVTTDGELYGFSPKKFGTADAQVEAHYELWQSEDGETLLSGFSASSVPIGGMSLGNNGVDLRSGVVAGFRFSNLTLLTSAEALWRSQQEIENIRFKPWIFGGSVGLSYSAAENVQLAATVVGQQRGARNLRVMPTVELYLDTAIRWFFHDSAALSLLVRENPLEPRRTTDVSLFVALDFFGPNRAGGN